jgi:hypothetical protein
MPCACTVQLGVTATTDESLQKTQALRAQLQEFERATELKLAELHSTRVSSLSMIQLMTYVLFDTIARAKDRSPMNNWCQFLATHFCQFAEARVWLLQQVALLVFRVPFVAVLHL